MRKLLIVMVLLVVVPSVMGSYDLLRYYSFDSDLIDSVGGLNGSAVGGLGYNTSDYKLGSASLECVNNDAIYASLPDIEDFDNDWTVEMWLNVDANTDQDIFLGAGNGGSKRYQFGTLGTGQSWLYGEQTGDVNFPGVSVLGTDHWHHVAFVRNGTNFTIYVNGTEDNSTIDTPTINATPNFYACRLSWDVGNPFDGSIDELAVYSNALSPSEVWRRYTEPQQYPFVYGDIASEFISPTPADGVTNNTQVTINVNCTGADRVYLWFNESTDPNYAVLDNSTIWNYTTSVVDSSKYYYKAACFNTTTDAWSANLTTRSWTYDVVSPTLTTSLTNNSVYISGASNFTADFNFSDNFLIHSYNISVGDTQYYYNGSVNSESINVTISLSPADFTGFNTINATFADAHTTLQVQDYDVKTPLFTNDYVRYEFNKADYIKIKADSLFDKITTTKLVDRYVWDFEPSSVSNSYTFTITASKKFEVVTTPNGEYGGKYLISGNKWVDFVVQDSLEDVSIILLDDYTAEVTVTGNFDKLNKLKFSSVGDLNVVEKDYGFFVSTGTEEYDSSKVETDTSDYKFNLTFNSSLIADIEATITYNGTEYEPTKTSYSDYIQFNHSFTEGFVGGQTNVTFLWNYTIYGLDETNISDTFTTHNTTIFPFYLDNCTTYSTQAINFTFINVNSTGIQATFGGVITYWNGSSSLSKNYTLNADEQLQHTLCISPHFTALHSSESFIMGRDQYNNYHYVNTADYITNATDFRVIELTATSNADTVTITVVDESDNPLQGYTLETYRYDLVSDNYTLVDSQLTNTVGKVVVYLSTADYEYLFYVKNQSGSIVYTEPKSTITESSYTFRVILGSAVESIRLKLSDLDYLLTANKTTRNFTLSWTDTIGVADGFMLRVVTINATDTTTLSEQISYSNSSDLSYNFTNSSGIYTGQFYAQSSDDGQWYNIDSVSIDIRVEYDLFGGDSILMSFFFIGTAMLVGAFVSAGLAVMFTIVGMVLFYALGFYAVSLSGLGAIIAVLFIALVKVAKR